MEWQAQTTHTLSSESSNKQSKRRKRGQKRFYSALKQPHPYPTPLSPPALYNIAQRPRYSLPKWLRNFLEATPMGLIPTQEDLRNDNIERAYPSWRRKTKARKRGLNPGKLNYFGRTLTTGGNKATTTLVRPRQEGPWSLAKGNTGQLYAKRKT